MARAAHDLTLGDRMILGMLPLVGDTVGGHTLKKPVRSLVEDLGFQFTPAELNGRLRGLSLRGLTVLHEGETGKARHGWQATAEGRALVEEWDSMLVSRALTAANKDGDGLAEVQATPDGPVVAYVLTPARYERMADDPGAGRTRITPKQVA